MPQTERCATTQPRRKTRMPWQTHQQDMQPAMFGRRRRAVTQRRGAGFGAGVRSEWTIGNAKMQGHAPPIIAGRGRGIGEFVGWLVMQVKQTSRCW